MADADEAPTVEEGMSSGCEQQWDSVTGIAFRYVTMGMHVKLPIEQGHQQVAGDEDGQTAKPANIVGKFRQQTEEGYAGEKASAEGNHAAGGGGESRHPKTPERAGDGYGKCNSQ